MLPGAGLTAAVYRPLKRFSGGNPAHAVITTDAVAEGLRVLGFEVSRPRLPDLVRADLAVSWSVYKRRFPETECREEMVLQQRARGGDTLIVELGWIARERHYLLGFERAGGRGRYAAAPDRPRGNGLDSLIPSSLERREGPVLLIGQVPSDTACQHIDLQEWITRRCAELCAAGEQVLFRPHPLAGGAIRTPPGAQESTASLSEDLARCSRVETFNSTVGVDAILAGVPAVAADEGSMIYGRDLDTEQALTDWGRFLLWNQWTLDEMASGEALRHILTASSSARVREAFTCS